MTRTDEPSPVPARSTGRRTSVVLDALIAIAASLASAAASADTYRLEPIHCQVLFFADHLGFSRQMGRFTGVSGTFRFDPDDPASAAVDAEIDVGTLWLGDAAWERKVLSDDFFDAKRWPTMRYVSTRVEAVGENRIRVDGELTLRGVTRPVALDVRVNRIGRNSFTLQHRAGFSATASIRRSAFGMRRLLAAVGDEVEIRLEIEGVRVSRGDAPERMPAGPSSGDEVGEPSGVEGPVEFGAIRALQHRHPQAVGLGQRPEPSDLDPLPLERTDGAQKGFGFVAEFATVTAIERQDHGGIRSGVRSID